MSADDMDTSDFSDSSESSFEDEEAPTPAQPARSRLDQRVKDKFLDYIAHYKYANNKNDAEAKKDAEEMFEMFLDSMKQRSATTEEQLEAKRAVLNDEYWQMKYADRLRLWEQPRVFGEWAQPPTLRF